MELPVNFNKYLSIITYYKNNNVDCLSTLVEWFRFYIIHIFSKDVKYTNELHNSFLTTLCDKTNLKHKNDFLWGRWSSPVMDNFYSYDIMKLHFYMPGKFHMSFKLNEQFLYDELSNVPDIEIEDYLNNLCSYGNLLPITQIYKPNVIIITNKFNESKIIVQKELFSKYCGYSKMLEDYELIKTFAIDIFFEDKVADDLSSLLNEKEYTITNYKRDELEQKFNLMDFLQITLNYDSIKSSK